MTNETRNGSSTVSAVIILGSLFIFGMIIVCVLVAIPDSQNPAYVLASVFGFLGIALPALLNASQGQKANAKLDRVLNGEMDSKMQRNIHSVLDERE